VTVGSTALIGGRGFLQGHSLGMLDLGDSPAAGNSGVDTIHGDADNDVVAAGGKNDNVFGDAGDDYLEGNGGADTISGGVGLDDIVGGSSPSTGGSQPDDGDTINGNDDGDVVLGDNGSLSVPAGILTTITPLADSIGGADTIRTGTGADIVMGGTGGDLIDSGAGNDIVLGDNALLDRTGRLGDFRSPLFRALTGTQIYDASTGAALTDAGWQVDPQGSSWWSDFVITLVDVAGTTAASFFGNDYIAGGAGNDLIFGGNGDDVIQGDGSIDYAAQAQLPAICGIGPVGAAGIDSRTLVGGCRDAAHVLYLNPSQATPAGGNDYIEGGAGADRIFGNGGEDNLIGGSSNLFGQTTAALRTDASNLIFGGSGIAIALNEAGDNSVNGMADDSDAIVANNGLILDIVGTNRVSSGAFLVFNYDSQGNPTATKRIIPRAVSLLDYTLGGPDYAGLTVPVVPGDVVAASELHGESGNDFMYGGGGEDAISGAEAIQH
jgi:Ca2+-binding RTX toxin-like protein